MRILQYNFTIICGDRVRADGFNGAKVASDGQRRRIRQNKRCQNLLASRSRNVIIIDSHQHITDSQGTILGVTPSGTKFLDACSATGGCEFDSDRSRLALLYPCLALGAAFGQEDFIVRRIIRVEPKRHPLPSFFGKDGCDLFYTCFRDIAVVNAK
eukprot:CAMPEP_0182926008 /NCGR_PEP_ID=MMETSP0105_2-20130417/10777_1 /TAXON_ID=81532 ORGANISM="Acanthoeca-like sp., Strain 10tr" /NCGR_SAMPLE_ID=MMETSP0105_2 /ASSEMBLY_ACC=CAM_ASM_000205 /LENGTH=155 /DNA_ID=CAMNT_0025063879 /DNA_START=138 /DNA_END=605 /DNA_ORIENTATION=-